MNITKKRLAAAAASTAVALALPVAALASYGPARPTFQCVAPSNCPGPNYVTFNSYTNAPNYGDERAFFDGKDAAITASGGFQDVIQVRDGEEVYLRVYIHNNANPGIMAPFTALARNTTVRVLLPTSQKTDNFAAAMISADNATPGTVSDTLTFRGERPFKLSYVPGSAKFEYRPDGSTWTVSQVPDSIATSGANLGDIKGCFEYSGFVTLKAKVSMPGPTATPQPTQPTPAPAQPAVAKPLPETGPEAGLAAAAGTGAIGYAVRAYRRSRKALVDSLLNR